MELLVQQYLRSGKTLENLKLEHGVKSRVSNGKISLSYDQIEAKESDPIACECRGLILREGTYDRIAYPFQRFFNLGQNEAANIYWKNAKFIDKLDGSLAIVYWDEIQNKWCVATRGMPEAEGRVNTIDMTFAELFNYTVNKIGSPVLLWDHTPNIQDLMAYCKYNQDGIENPAYCFSDIKNITLMFELVSPFNRIVCKYDEPQLFLLGARNTVTCHELYPDRFSFDNFNVQQAKSYSFKSLDDMFLIIKDWNPIEHEGLVVRDGYFNRVKVKTPAYLAAAHIRDSVVASVRSCVEIILLKKEDDVMSLIPPPIVERINKLKVAIRQLIVNTEAEYERLKGIENIKEFALEAQKYMYSAPLFAVRRNKAASVSEFINGHLKENKFPDSFLDTIYELAKKIDGSIV